MKNTFTFFLFFYVATVFMALWILQWSLSTATNSSVSQYPFSQNHPHKSPYLSDDVWQVEWLSRTARHLIVEVLIWISTSTETQSLWVQYLTRVCNVLFQCIKVIRLTSLPYIVSSMQDE